MGMMFSGCLFFLVVCGDEGRTAGEPGLSPGDRFSVRIDYSNRWSEERLSLDPRKSGGQKGAPRESSGPSAAPGWGPGSLGRSAGLAGRPAAPASGYSGLLRRAPSTGGRLANPRASQVPEPAAAKPTHQATNTGQIQSANAGQDPLLVALSLRGEARDRRHITLKLDVSRVEYFDNRGCRWTIEPKKDDAASRAEKLAEEIAPRWRSQSTDSLEKEMLEEQLLGVALVRLDGAAAEVEIESPGAEVRLFGLEGLLEERLPEAFPSELRYQVTSFFLDAVRKITAPPTDRLVPGSRIECGGIPYSVERLYRRGGRDIAKIFAKTYRAEGGAGLKDSVTFDVKTGLVLERSFLRHKDALRGSEVRFGATRWQVTLSEFKPAAAR